MPKVSFGAIGTGLPKNIVQKLIKAERIPIKKLKAKKAKTNEKLDLVNQLSKDLRGIKDSLGGLSSRNGFKDMKLRSGNESIVSGTVNPEKAQKGSWNVEVKRLAQKAAALTNGFADKNKTEVGVGYFRFETPEGEKEVYIDGENNTLQGVVNQINAADVGVRASIINDRENSERPYRLMISAEDVGDKNQVKYPQLYFLGGDQDIYFEKERPAKNGLIEVDGFEFQVSSNTVKDAIPGATLDLKQAAKGKDVNLSVKEDLENISKKANKFVKATNKVLKFIQQQNSMDENTDTSKTLGGDSVIRSVESRLRRTLQGGRYDTKGPINRLSQLGIQFNRNGTLNFDENQFNSALQENPKAVEQFLIGNGLDSGFIHKVEDTIDTLTSGRFGPVKIRKRGLQQKIDRMSEEISDKERRLQEKEKRLRKKFSRLSRTMSKLKSQRSALSGLGGGGGGGAGGGMMASLMSGGG